MFSIAFGMLNLFLYCYFGKRSTDYYTSFADHLYDSNWIVLPADLQNMYVLIIAHAQKPLLYHGCGIAYLNLEIFGKVCWISSASTVYF